MRRHSNNLLLAGIALVALASIPASTSAQQGYSSDRRQEVDQLASSNTASAPVTTFGGNYVLAQQCSTYGTVNLQVLGPDDVTWRTIAALTAADTAGGTAVSLGSGAVVRSTLSGTAGCFVRLSRVPQ